MPHSNVSLRRAAAVLVGFALAIPNAAAAAPAQVVDSTGDENDPRLVEAQALHDQGQAAYETYDYPAAIAAWTRAYARIEGHPRAEQIRHAVVYNLAAARMAQFRVDEDKSQLELAKRLLTKYSEALDRDAQSERAQVTGKIAEIDALLGEGDAEPESTPPPVVVPPTGDDDRPPDRARGTGLIAGGSIAIAGGVGAMAGMAVGLAQGRAAQRGLDDPMRPAADLPGLREDAHRANRIAIACGVSAAVLVAAGVAMLVVGARKRARSSKSAAVWLGSGVAWNF